MGSRITEVIMEDIRGHHGIHMESGYVDVEVLERYQRALKRIRAMREDDVMIIRGYIYLANELYPVV